MVTVSERVVLPSAATGVGSMPGTDAGEAAAVVLGELPGFPHLPELPARGAGADTIGRTAAVLVDMAVEVVPSGYRVTSRAGHHHRAAVDLLRRDLDGFSEAMQRAGTPSGPVKTQFAGPWTLAAHIELARGHRVLTDHGAHRDLVESFLEGLVAHVAELRERSGADVVVQLDEPALPAVLAGSLPTPSGYGTVGAVPEPEVRNLLSGVFESVAEIAGAPVIAHSCDPRPPVALLRASGAGALSVDAQQLSGAPASLLDEIGEAWDAGTTFLLGLVPATDPEGSWPSLHDVARPALSLVDRLGFNRSILAERTIPTPTCGLAGANKEWTRRALSLSGDLVKAFAEPPEGW